MADDLVELGFEGFDRVVDKYYDNIHDGVGKGYQGARGHFPRKKGHKAMASFDVPKPSKQRASSEPREDQYKRSSADVRTNKRNDDDHDQGYASDSPPRRSRRGSLPSRENEPTNGNEPYRKPYPDELPKDSNHIYPPPPPQVRNDPAGRQPYGPPFNQQPFGAPPVPQAYGVAPGPRGYAGLPLYVPYPAQQTNNNQRTNTPNPASGRDTHDQRGDSLSRERRRERNRDSRDSGSSRRSKDHKPKDRSIAASLAGAVAGGLVGHQAGKGDILATAAGALVGALGGGMAADKHVQAKYKRDESDKDWQRQHGR